MEKTSEKDANEVRALRLRDNKRRSRARQREYVADLERRVRKLEQEGVQSAKEMQLLARKAVEDNERLRRMLRHMGVDEENINTWGRCPAKEIDACNKSRSVPTTGIPRDQCPSISHEPEHAIPANALPMPGSGQQGGSASEADSTDELGRAGERCRADDVGSSSPCVNRQSETSPQVNPPCKLLTYLKSHPGADITQVPLLEDDGTKEGDPIVEDGIPCSSAYKMLIHYATTEPKLDAVAHVLEQGCVPNAGPSGGCRVKSKTLMKALDNLCS